MKNIIVNSETERKQVRKNQVLDLVINVLYQSKVWAHLVITMNE